MLVALQRLAVRFFCPQLLRHPMQIVFIARKGLDKMSARHFAFGHAHVLDAALAAAHFFNQAAHGVTQCVNLLCGEAELHKFIRDAVL